MFILVNGALAPILTSVGLVGFLQLSSNRDVRAHINPFERALLDTLEFDQLSTRRTASVGHARHTSDDGIGQHVSFRAPDILTTNKTAGQRRVFGFLER